MERELATLANRRPAVTFGVVIFLGFALGGGLLAGLFGQVVGGLVPHPTAGPAASSPAAPATGG